MHSDVILKRLMTLHPKTIDLTLGRTVDLLGKLGRPQDRLPPVVHVAGTNGKGSTVAFLRAICEAAGLRVHTYTSPHLVRFAERICLAGRQIEETHLAALLEDCERANAGEPITFFEITTCAAFKAFSEAPADILLLEVGLGGRMDATNVIDRPACTVITPISMDHMQFLGDSLEAIAAEKAAIQKAERPSVVTPQDPSAMAVIEREAARVGARIRRADPVGEEAILSLAGRHQRINAGAAIAAAEALRAEGYALTGEAVRRGLASARWPARLQRLSRGPIPDGLPGWEIWLDGGHNEAAGEVLADMLSTWRDRPLHAVVGMLNTKEPTAFLQPLAPHVATMRTVAIPGVEATFTAAELAGFAQAVGIDAQPARTVAEAVADLPGGPRRLLITGSLYLAGAILAENG